MTRDSNYSRESKFKRPQQRGGNRGYQKQGRSHRPPPKYVPPPPPPAEEVAALVSEISEALNEDNKEQLTKAIEIIGLERARSCFTKAVEIEASGGMMIISGKRRRTPGGVFFYMVRTDASKDERRVIFPNLFTEKAQPPSWKECNIYIAKLLQQSQKGTVSKVKLTLIGRPKQVAKSKTCMVAIMEGRPVPESMPKGLPSPPNAGSRFAVFIATKQWNRVAATLKENKDDELIIEGYPIFDPAKKVTAVLAQGVTTKVTQRIGAARKKAGEPMNEDDHDEEELEEATEESVDTDAEPEASNESRGDAGDDAEEAADESADDSDDDGDSGDADDSDDDSDDNGSDDDESADDSDDSDDK